MELVNNFCFIGVKGALDWVAEGYIHVEVTTFCCLIVKKKNLLLSFFNELNYAVNLGMPSWVCLLSIYAVI